MKSKLILLIVIAYSVMVTICYADNAIGKSPTSTCNKFDNADNTLENNNPGIFYFKEAMCRSKSINNANDFTHVINLFKKSADNKFPASYFALGLLFEEKYKHGSLYYGAHGQPSDIVEAIRYYKLASSFGSTTAENNIGVIYLNEENLSSNYKTKNVDVEPINNIYVTLPNMQQAVLWLNIAAKHGNPAAQGTLADLYKAGIGVPQNYMLAYVWSNLSITSQYNFNVNVGDKILELIITSEKQSRDDSYSKLTDEQKNTANKLLDEYSAKYFLKPNDFEKFCSAIQSMLLIQDSMKLIGN